MAVQFEKPIALGADHGGYELKEAITQHLEERGIAYRDFGTNSTASCDYPDYATATCGAVTNGKMCIRDRPVMLAAARIGPCKWFAAFGITSKVSPRRGESTHLRLRAA